MCFSICRVTRSLSKEGKLWMMTSRSTLTSLSRTGPSSTSFWYTCTRYPYMQKSHATFYNCFDVPLLYNISLYDRNGYKGAYISTLIKNPDPMNMQIENAPNPTHPTLIPVFPSVSVMCWSFMNVVKLLQWQFEHFQWRNRGTLTEFNHKILRVALIISFRTLYEKHYIGVLQCNYSMCMSFC